MPITDAGLVWCALGPLLSGVFGDDAKPNYAQACLLPTGDGSGSVWSEFREIRSNCEGSQNLLAYLGFSLVPELLLERPVVTASAFMRDEDLWPRCHPRLSEDTVLHEPLGSLFSAPHPSPHNQVALDKFCVSADNHRKQWPVSSVFRVSVKKY